MFKATHPILGTRDMPRAIAFYVYKLGFEIAFESPPEAPQYVGYRRDAVEIHMQFQLEHEMSRTRLRFVVEDPDALCDEYQRRGVECSPAGIQTTAWGTREFALWDPDRNALTFYRNVPKEDG